MRRVACHARPASHAVQGARSAAVREGVSGKSFGAILATAVAATAVRLAIHDGAPDDLVLILVWLAFGGIAIGTCFLAWRILRAVIRRIDRALPDRERDQRSELALAYEKACLERWVQTGTSGDGALDAKFEAMRGGYRRSGPPSSSEAPRTIALGQALEADSRPAAATPESEHSGTHSAGRFASMALLLLVLGGAGLALAARSPGGGIGVAIPATADEDVDARPVAPAVATTTSLADEEYAAAAHQGASRLARSSAPGTADEQQAFCERVDEQALTQAYPMRGDAETVITGGASADCHVIFENKLINFTRMGDYLLGRGGTPVAVAELLPEFQRKIQASCSNPRVNGIFTHGGSLTHKYFDKSGRYVTSVTVTSNDCGLP